MSNLNNIFNIVISCYDIVFLMKKRVLSIGRIKSLADFSHTQKWKITTKF